jgi:guanine deaminase
VDLGGDDYFIAPGFVDTHVHLPQFDGIGCDGLPLLEWLNTLVFPLEGRWEDASYAASMTDRVLDQFLANGTTSFCAFATVHHQATIAALELAAQRGLRACIGQSLMDRNSPDFLTRPTKRLAAEALALCQKFPPGGVTRVEHGITPRFAASCTVELMQEMGKLSQATGAMVQTHLAETIPECRWVEELFSGRLYANVYEAMGLLGKRSLLGHGIHLAESERAAIRNSQSVIVHCPNANVFLQSGIMPRSKWLSEQLRLSLGSDLGAGFDVAMPRVARSMIDTAKYLRFQDAASQPPTAAEAWHQITAGNADAAGWPQIGRLQAGAEADMLIIRPTIPWRDAPDPLSMLLYAWDSRWIESILIAGTKLE